MARPTINTLKEHLEAWRYDDVAYDCIAEIADGYYQVYTMSASVTGVADLRCIKCHQKKPEHLPGCIVGKAGLLLEKLKDLGEI